MITRGNEHFLKRLWLDGCLLPEEKRDIIEKLRVYKPNHELIKLYEAEQTASPSWCTRSFLFKCRQYQEQEEMRDEYYNI